MADVPGYKMRLYIAGPTPKSQVAVRNVKRICEEHLAGRYEMDIADLYQQPARAAEDGIVAIPTLVRYQPLPVRRIIGDFSDVQRVLKGLEVHPAA